MNAYKEYINKYVKYLSPNVSNIEDEINRMIKLEKFLAMVYLKNFSGRL
jgi:hypothetical protein